MWFIAIGGMSLSFEKFTGLDFQLGICPHVLSVVLVVHSVQHPQQPAGATHNDYEMKVRMALQDPGAHEGGGRVDPLGHCRDHINQKPPRPSSLTSLGV